VFFKEKRVQKNTPEPLSRIALRSGRDERI
jgi:hypothetical protein